MKTNTVLLILFLLVSFSLFLWVFLSPSSPPLPPQERPEFTNKCNVSEDISQKEPIRRDLGSTPRLPTLVIYVYAEADKVKKKNFEFFLRHGLCENCHNIDYAFIINGNKLTVDIPKHKNIFILRRDNVCGDFGAWDHLFREMDPKKYKKYKRFMFLNDTVLGPFINPNYLILFSQDFHFTDLFSAVLTEETRLVGSYIHCGNLDPVAVVGFSHVQTMSFMLDDVALELSRPLMRCYTDYKDIVSNGEIGLSKNLISNNINIAAMMYSYKGIDFRCNDPEKFTCNNLDYAVFQGKYFGTSINPMEVVFIKANDKVFPNKEMLKLYAGWADYGIHGNPI